MLVLCWKRSVNFNLKLNSIFSDYDCPSWYPGLTMNNMYSNNDCSDLSSKFKFYHDEAYLNSYFSQVHAGKMIPVEQTDEQDIVA